MAERRHSGTTSLFRLQQAIILGMSPDPNPDDCAIPNVAESSIVIADANCETILTAVQRAETQGRVIRIFQPEAVILFGEVLDR